MGDVVEQDNYAVGTPKACLVNSQPATYSKSPSILDFDPYQQFWFSTTQATSDATQHPTEGSVNNLDDYRRIQPHLFPDHAPTIVMMRPWADRQRRGEAVVWATLEGFFWFPRALMDIERL